MKKAILIFLCLFLPILSFAQTATKVFVAEKERYLADLTSINGQLYLSYGKVESPYLGGICGNASRPPKRLIPKPYKYNFEAKILQIINIKPLDDDIFKRFSIYELDSNRIVIAPSNRRNPYERREKHILYLANNDLSDIQQVKNMNTKTKYPNYIFRKCEKLDNKLFFYAYNDEKVKTLWETDGTMEGTKEAIASKKIEKEENKNNKTYYFIAEKDKTKGKQIYYSDGKDTIAIANQLKKGFEPQSLLFVGNKAYFTANSKKGIRELWVIDKKKKKCHQITSFNNEKDKQVFYLWWNWFTWDNKLFFMAKTKDKGMQLFATDGKKYHQLIDEIGVEAPNILRFSYAEIGNEMYITYGNGENGHANQIWKIMK